MQYDKIKNSLTLTFNDYQHENGQLTKTYL